MDCVLRFCLRHKGVVVLFGGQGARERNGNVQRWHCQSGGTLIVRNLELPCVRASLVNVVGCLRGSTTGIFVKHEIQGFHDHIQKSGQLGIVVHQLGLKLTVSGLGKLVKNEMRKDGFMWMLRPRHGVWLVRLCNPLSTDHYVAVDANRGVILDSEECCPISLNQESLRMCTGMASDMAHVGDVYQLRDA